MTRYEHAGNAKATTLSADITSTALTIPLTDPTGWPDGSIGLFWLSLGKGTPTEEKVLCSSRAGSVVQVFTDVGGNGRGADGTVARDHDINVTVEHIWTATEADQANIHINTGDGAHGYPPKADLVTLDGAQAITGVKTMHSPELLTPVVVEPAVAGGQVIGASKVSLAGAQAEAEFRVRNTYIGTGIPDNSLGNDGDIYISKSE